MVLLKLVQLDGGRAKVIACNESGDRLPLGNLLVFERDGTIRKIGGINSELGFMLDSMGCITIRDEGAG